MRRLGQKPSQRPTSALGVGVLELQRNLQPDRKVETLAEEMKGERQRPEYRPGPTGDGDPEE